MFLFWVFIAVLLVLSLIFVFVHLQRNVWNPMGTGSEKKTASILRRFGGIRDYKVLSDVTVCADGKTVQIENMLIGYFGILLVTTCGRRGEYYGTLDADTWTVSPADGETGPRETIANPWKEQQKALALLRTLFAKNNLYKIPVEHVVYVSHPSRKTCIYVTHKEEIIPPGKLGAYLEKTKFENDAGIDIDKLVKVLTASQEAR